MLSYRKDNTRKGLNKLKLIEEERPVPERGEVLVQIKATSLNFIDRVILEQDNSNTEHNNHIPLSDGAGEIVELGADVKRFKLGDRVIGNFNQEWIGGKDRKSTRLNSSHVAISYTVFCLKNENEY